MTIYSCKFHVDVHVSFKLRHLGKVLASRPAANLVCCGRNENNTQSSGKKRLEYLGKFAFTVAKNRGLQSIFEYQVSQKGTAFVEMYNK